MALSLPTIRSFGSKASSPLDPSVTDGATTSTPSPGSGGTDGTPAPSALPLTPDGRGGAFGPRIDEPDAADDGSAGVHAITKKTNYWFEREVHVIERRADESAAEWAHKGLPRHDVARTEPLEPEQVLGKLCAQTFRDWQLRVRTKMQDAIEQGSQQLGEHVATLRTRVARLETLKHDLEDREQRIERIRRESERDEQPVRYERFIPAGLFWPAVVLLAIVEFVANFPVFRLLLPMNAALSKVASGAADGVDTDSLWAGVHMLGVDLATHVEAAVVAMVAVVVLVVLGKLVGQGLRPIVSLNETEHPLAAQTIRAHRRQHLFVVVIGSLGTLCVLGFLYSARAGIADATHERVVRDRAALDSAQVRLGEAQAAKDLAMITDASNAAQVARDVLRQHEEDERYASTVHANNVPIFFLNVALVLTAGVLGYGFSHRDLGDKRGEHPDLVKLRDRCNELHREQLVVDHEARAAAGLAHASVGRVQHLLNAHPLRGWESKVMRLESVIPRFRGENARLRGLDPANIRAFDERPQLDLPPLDENAGLQEPAEFARLRGELQALLVTHAQLAPRMAPARNLAVVA